MTAVIDLNDLKAETSNSEMSAPSSQAQVMRACVEDMAFFYFLFFFMNWN